MSESMASSEPGQVALPPIGLEMGDHYVYKCYRREKNQYSKSY